MKKISFFSILKKSTKLLKKPKKDHKKKNECDKKMCSQKSKIAFDIVASSIQRKELRWIPLCSYKRIKKIKRKKIKKTTDDMKPKKKNRKKK